MSSGDLPLLAAPRISFAGFRAILHRHGSPALAEALACYAAFRDAGVDPAVGLAIFKHESGYGRAGIATRNRSWGNIRHAGVFVAYDSWTAGARGLAALLVVYGHNEIRPGRKTSTILTFAHVYAPAADHNDPTGYGQDVLALVTAWARLYPPGKPTGTGGRVRARHLAALWAARGGTVARVPSSSARGMTFSAWSTGRLRRPLSTGGRGTFYKILSGSHAGRYIHVSDPGVVFAPIALGTL